MSINTLDPENSVLFLGSGFSAGAINIANEEVPAGHPLLERLATTLKEEVKDLDLKSAADEFLSRNNMSLYDLLYETFTISKILPHQREIIEMPWARIYTTNYDDIVSQIKGPGFPLYTFDDPRPRKLPKAFVAHLHGSIRRANEENANDELILNNRSYDIISRGFPVWFHEFQRDRRTFDACYFLGFSLSDHHIAGLMTAGEESVKRTYFITRDDPKASFVRRASEYGEVSPIGFDGFVRLTVELPKPDKPRELADLHSFKYLRPGLDSKVLAAPTPVEIINLVSLGTFNQSRYFNTLEEHQYVARRQKLVRDALDALKTAKTILVHSRLGNGKSIFSSILALKATMEGYACLLWRREGRHLAQDLEVISAHRRALIIFDDYDAAIENIDRVAAGAPDAKFVVTVRTGQQEVRFHEILQRLPSPVHRLSLNIFNDSDKEELLAILHKAGAQVNTLTQTVRTARDIRDVVTQLYNHSQIRGKIQSVVGSAPSGMTQIVVLASLIKWAGVETDDNYLQEIAGRDIYAELRRSENDIIDFLDMHDDKVEMRSSLLSEYFLQRIFSSKDVLDGCYEVTTSAMRRKSNRAYRRLSGELMKFSTLQSFLKFSPESDDEIDKHYIRLSNDKDVNAEPLFWLQYAILMKTSGDIEKARMFLQAGYERAAELEGYKTFQLDTQALSIYLMHEARSKNPTVEGLEEILDSIKTVTDMISEESNRYYAVEVIGEIPSFVDVRHSALTEPEKIALVFELNRVSKSLSALPVEEKTYTGSEIIRARIEKSISNLTQ